LGFPSPNPFLFNEKKYSFQVLTDRKTSAAAAPERIEFTFRGDYKIRWLYGLEFRNNLRTCDVLGQVATKIEDVDGYVFGVDPLKYAYFSEPVIENLNSSIPYSFIYLNQTVGNYTTNTTYCLVSERLFQKILSPMGSNITIEIADNSTVNITIAAVIKSNVFLGNGEYLYISTTKFQEFFNSTRATWFLCDVVGEVSTAQVLIESSFPGIFKPGSVMGIDFYTKAIESSLNFQSGFFQILFIESFILAAIAQFVCILVSTLRMEREMGIIRAVGLHRLGVFDIFMSESVALGFSALIVGVLDGLLGSFLLAWYISLSIPITVNFPLERILLWVIASFLITLASTFIPSFRSSRKSIVATISGRPFRREYRDKSVLSLMQLYYPFQKPELAQEQMIQNLQEGGKVPYYSSTTMWKFIKNHSLQIQTTFLVLMAIITLNYIVDGSLIVRGLNPFDTIWRLYYIIFSSFFKLESINSGPFVAGHYIDFFLIVNPILIFVGLAIIGPITYYFIHEHTQKRLAIITLKSFLWGAVGVVFCLLIPIILFIIALIGLDILNQVNENNSTILFSQSSIFIYLVIIIIVIIGLELLILQKLWVFLVIQGLIPESSFKQKISWVKNGGSKGQVKFIGLVLIHIIIQNFLFVLSQPFSDSFFLTYDLTHLPPVDPLAFLVLTTFEIGFFLLLLIHQIIQFQNQSYLLVPSSIDTSTSTMRMITIQDKGQESAYSSKSKSN